MSDCSGDGSLYRQNFGFSPRADRCTGHIPLPSSSTKNNPVIRGVAVSAWLSDKISTTKATSLDLMPWWKLGWRYSGPITVLVVVPHTLAMHLDRGYLLI